MAIIYTNTKPSKPTKKKPGWKKEQEEYEAWLAKHQSTQKQSKKLKDTKTSPSLKRSTQLSTLVLERLNFSASTPSKINPSTNQPVKIHDPKVLYKDNPEMLERELKARERKFPTAPAYNKGGDILLTPELMKDIQAGGTRRRG